ncbi:MAG: glycosyltransferase family 4 protein [Candidatus Aegiribacteria sp.]
MRILHLVHRSWPYHGGAERYVLEHALAGAARGHTSVICATDAWDMSWLVSRTGMHVERRRDVHRGIIIRRFPVRHPPLQDILRGILRRLLPCGRDRFFYPNPFVPSLNRWLSRDRGFDLVHANAMPFALYHGWRYSRRHGSGLVCVPHANVGEKFRRVEALHYFRGCQRRILGESSFVVAQSGFERDLYLEMGVEKERVHVSGSGIDPKEFEKADGEAARRRLGVEGTILLSLTGHCRDRGLEQMLETLAELTGRGLKATLVLAGPVMPDAQRLLDREVHGNPDLENRVVVTGYIRKEDRIDLIRAADVVMLPSRLDCFGIVVLEAWMLGRPVIGCWSGGMPDIIREGENGFLVPFGDTATLAHRTELLLRDPSLRRSMGEAGQRLVKNEWTWERVTDRFYRRLSQCHAGGGPA